MRTIGIVACSDPQRLEWKEQNERLVSFLERTGSKVLVSRYIYENDCPLETRAESCAGEVMKMFLDPEVEDIYDISGGNVANEVLEYLDFDIIKRSHATFWGYSDLSTIINAIQAKTGKASVLFQVKNMVVGDFQELQRSRFKDGDDLFDVKWDIVQGTRIEGLVFGGNIRCFLKLAGTSYFPDAHGKVLFLESCGGQILQMITCLSQLKAMGVFNRISGILLGTFISMEENHCNPDMVSLVKRFVGDLIPIAKTSEIGHGNDSKALRIGSMIRISR